MARLVSLNSMASHYNSMLYGPLHISGTLMLEEPDIAVDKISKGIYTFETLIGDCEWFAHTFGCRFDRGVILTSMMNSKSYKTITADKKLLFL